MLDSYSMKITPFPARLDCVNSDITISLAGSPRIPVYDFFLHSFTILCGKGISEVVHSSKKEACSSTCYWAAKEDTGLSR